ncbi:MAG: alkane 1-monooxygenase [Cyanobacteriota bacterium]
MSSLKYLISYIVPFSALIALAYNGFLSFATVIFVFFILPIVEFFMSTSTENIDKEKKDSFLKQKFFDLILYLNVPILYGIIFYYITSLNRENIQNIELIGITLSTGIVIGACGINVAHELGHRKNKFEVFLAKILLLPAFYMHFYIEHNRGHHKNVATEFDPATSNKGEYLYSFWLKSIIKSYFSAWKIQLNLLKKDNHNFISLKNEMLVFQVIQAIYILSIYYFFGLYTTLFVIFSGLIGVLLLETINYIEHYGLKREKLPTGNYENVKPKHSWNANYTLGRIVLYELTRHSDHHFLASKKYQILDYHEDSPQLPFGYPTCMLISFIPPLWFFLMDKKLVNYEKVKV